MGPAEVVYHQEDKVWIYKGGNLIKVAACFAKDAVGANYLEIERSVCFLENKNFTLEVPVSEHNRPDVTYANVKEIKNLEDGLNVGRCID